jgi:hypothetical protein
VDRLHPSILAGHVEVRNKILWEGAGPRPFGRWRPSPGRGECVWERGQG